MERLTAIENAINALIGPDSLRREFFVHEKFVARSTAQSNPPQLRSSSRPHDWNRHACQRNPRQAQSQSAGHRNHPETDRRTTRRLHNRISSPRRWAIRYRPFEDQLRGLAKAIQESKHKNTDLEALKAAIAAKLEKLVRLNRTRADFADKFEALIESYNNGSRNIEQLFEELLKLSNSLEAEQNATSARILAKRNCDLRHPNSPRTELSTAERDESRKLPKSSSRD